MKKLLLFTSLFLALSCSKDDEVSADPLIGTWSVNMTETVRGYPMSLVGTTTFDANGSQSSEIVLTYMEESETDKQTDKWSNDASKPDFSSTIQNYTWGDDKYSAVFSSDFKSVALELIEEKDETASSQNSEDDDDDDEDEDIDPFRIIRLTRK